MKSKFDVIYNLSSAKRLLVKVLAATGKILTVEKTVKCNGSINVVYKIRFADGFMRRWAVFMSKKQFQKEFTEYRRESATFLKVSSGNKENEYKVSNPAKGTTQLARTYSDAVICLCEDYRSQIEAKFKHKACKHVYAVLNHLGFSSLADYLKPAPAF